MTGSTNAKCLQGNIFKTLNEVGWTILTSHTDNTKAERLERLCQLFTTARRITGVRGASL